jgi:hypothetical protein
MAIPVAPGSRAGNSAAVLVWVAGGRIPNEAIFAAIEPNNAVEETHDEPAACGYQFGYQRSFIDLVEGATPPLTWGFVVGDTGLEPVTSSVSGKRASQTAPIALAGVSRGGDGI